MRTRTSLLRGTGTTYTKAYRLHETACQRAKAEAARWNERWTVGQPVWVRLPTMGVRSWLIGPAVVNEAEARVYAPVQGVGLYPIEFLAPAKARPEDARRIA